MNTPGTVGRMSIEHGYEIDRMGEPDGCSNTRYPALDPPFLSRPGESVVHFRHTAPSRACLILPTVARAGAA